MKKLRIGDTVMVRTGVSRGQTGEIAAFRKGGDYVVIEGVNRRIRHVKPRGGMEGGRIEFFAPIHASNVGIVDPKTGKPSRVRIEEKDGSKKRVLVKSGTNVEDVKTAKPAAKKKTEKKEEVPEKAEKKATKKATSSKKSDTSDKSEASA